MALSIFYFHHHRCGFMLSRLLVVAVTITMAHPMYGAIFKEGFSGKSMEGSRNIVLTFDDGPGDYDYTCEAYIEKTYPAYNFRKTTTENLIQLLDQWGPKINDRAPIVATFFLKGDILARHPAAAKQIVSAGHRLENHSFRHKNSLAFLNPKELMKDLRMTHDLIEKLTGRAPRFFRPPYGAWSKRLVTDFEANPIFSKYAKPVLWNIDSRDWFIKRECNIELIASILIQRMYMTQGGIVLLHDIHAVSIAALYLVLNRIVRENKKITNSPMYRGEPWKIVPLEHAYSRHAGNAR